MRERVVEEGDKNLEQIKQNIDESLRKAVADLQPIIDKLRNLNQTELKQLLDHVEGLDGDEAVAPLLFMHNALERLVQGGDKKDE